MNRPRSLRRKGWPDYLISRKKPGGDYYSWKHPKTGKEYGLGYSYPEAAAQARLANMSLSPLETSKVTLADRISETATGTMNEWLDIFAKKLSVRPSAKKGGTERAESTKGKDRRFIEIIRNHFAGSLIKKISTKECAELIRKYSEQGKDRTAVTVRSYLVDCFNEAIAEGWIERGTNPAEITKTKRPSTKRGRLSLDDFKTLLDSADGWMRTAMLLGIVTGQRVIDIAGMEYSQVKKGFLCVQQIKTGARIRIPTQIAVLDYSLEKVIKQSRFVVGSKTIVHQNRKSARSLPGSQISERTISNTFSRMVTAKLGTKWEGTPPTFHEIRALSKQLHKANGVDTLALLGHDSEETGKIYDDPRAGWVEIKLPKTA